MAKIQGLDADVELSAQYQVPRRIYDIKATPDLEKRSGVAAGASAKSSSAQAIAENFLRSIEGDLDISVDPAHLRFDKVQRSPLGRHVLFQQYFDGKPVSTGWIRVDLDDDYRVYGVQNDTIPLKAAAKAVSAKAGAAVQPDKAIQVAFAESSCNESKTREVLQSELVYYPYKSEPRLAWKVVVRGSEPPKEFKVYVDAESGEVLEKIDMIRQASGSATLFDPNPVVTLNDSTLKDDSAIPAGAYKKVELRDLSGTGFLDGKFVSTKRTSSRVQRDDHQFLLQRGDKGFNEVMIYFHIDRVQRYLQSLGFDNILNGPIEVDAQGTAADNSFYQPSTRALTFGTGGVDDAEDADIILHEYGHAIQDAQVPGFGQSSECRAMGEAFGDYLAASFFEAEKEERLKACVGTWDAVAYSSDDPPCLRRLDSKKKYPQDVHGEEHDDGELWSAFLWQLRKAIGKADVADKLVVSHHFLLTKTASFKDGVNALITADKKLNSGKHVADIEQLATARGFLP